MRVLIFHGYLLRGTGSNIYNAELAQTLKRMGHEVHLICQDREARKLSWVGGEGPGSVTVHVPDIGGLLPVFVADRYEGFEVKTFPELSGEELDRYLEANVRAVRDVIDRHGEPDAALANHLIMGPTIFARAGLARAGLARARLRFAIKIHGSDLSYTVRPHPDRFAPYAREGTDAAAGILVGSGHTAGDLFEVVDDPGLRERTRLGPPGVDVESFRPRAAEDAADAVEGLARGLEGEKAAGDDSFARDGAAAAAALRGWSAGEPRVLFVGKLLVNKGVDLLVAAWPLIHGSERAQGRAPRLLLVGFGAFRPGIEALVEALGEGDLAAARAVAAKGRAYEGGEEAPLPILRSFLADPPEGYLDAAREAAGSVAIGGRLEHEEVAEVMPRADAFVMPSTFPEAFGMVPAESAACGVPPVSADHSGMREVSRQLADAVGPERAPLLSFSVDENAVATIADRVEGWLGLEADDMERIGAALADRVKGLWSWEQVARGVIAASRGELDSLPRMVTDD